MARLRNPIDAPGPLTSRQRLLLQDLWERGEVEALRDFLWQLPGGVGAMAHYALLLDDTERAERYIQALLRG